MGSPPPPCFGNFFHPRFRGEIGPLHYARTRVPVLSTTMHRCVSWWLVKLRRCVSRQIWVKRPEMCPSPLYTPPKNQNVPIFHTHSKQALPLSSPHSKPLTTHNRLNTISTLHKPAIQTSRVSCKLEKKQKHSCSVLIPDQSQTVFTISIR